MARDGWAQNERHDPIRLHSQLSSFEKAFGQPVFILELRATPNGVGQPSIDEENTQSLIY